MSAPSCIPTPALEAKALSEIELAIRAGAVRALRTRADRQRQKAVGGTSSAGDRFPNIVAIARGCHGCQSGRRSGARRLRARSGGAVMSARVLGIDTGSQGAVALLSVSAALLADIVVNMKAATAYVEFVSARPGEGAVGAFAFGGVPLSFLTPAHWKRLCLIAVAGLMRAGRGR
jgi:hypothetical protein